MRTRRKRSRAAIVRARPDPTPAARNPTAYQHGSPIPAVIRRTETVNAVGSEIESDRKHEQDAEFGQLVDLGGVPEHTDAGRPDKDSRDEEADHGWKTQSMEDDQDGPRDEKHQHQILKQLGQMLFPSKEYDADAHSH
jgi:hypothetical protein